jgi:hypothetical protein
MWLHVRLEFDPVLPTKTNGVDLFVDVDSVFI